MKREILEEWGYRARKASSRATIFLQDFCMYSNEFREKRRSSKPGKISVID